MHPAMEPALKSTYGVMVTQEQVMQISKEMCGFTGGQADTLRKAIGKKNPEVMRKMKAEFIEGAIKTVGADRALMEKFWKQLEDFAAYCFNKAHSACYALIAYWTAYLKAHYPDAFMAALMTSDYDDTDRLAIEIQECRHMGIEVLPPDVNESFQEFAVVPGAQQVRFGMAAIKNVGTGAVQEILQARTDGPFTSLEDFFERVNVRVVNRKALESLIKAGALDRFGERSFLLFNLDVLLAYASRLQKEKASGQTDLFGELVSGDDARLKPSLKLQSEVAVYSQREQLQWERELLGLYLSQHPLDDYKTWLEEQAMALPDITPELHNKLATVAGVITDVRVIMTKNGQKMAFVQLADLSGEIELILFSRIFVDSEALWEKDRIVIVTGKIMGQDRDGKPSPEAKIMVDSAREVTHAEAKTYVPRGKKMKSPLKPKQKIKKQSKTEGHSQRLFVRMNDSQNQEQLMNLKRLIDAHTGPTEVVLVLGQNEQKQAIKLPMKVSATADALDGLRNLLGETNVKLQ
jgi:DNA polymerase-3 subunit alpha